MTDNRMIWVQQRPCGDVTLHASGPKPRCKGDEVCLTLHNGEEAYKLVSSNGSVRSIWFECVVNK